MDPRELPAHAVLLVDLLADAVNRKAQHVQSGVEEPIGRRLGQRQPVREHLRRQAVGLGRAHHIGDRLVQQRVRVRQRIRVRRDRERREPLGADTVLFHVHAHQRRVQRQERLAANAFELPIGRRRQRARDVVAADVRHALDAADRDGIRAV